jgi:acetyl esterase/lipase
MRVLTVLAAWAAPMLAGEPVVYKRTPGRDLKIHVESPPGWKATDRRAVVVFFYNGGWGNDNGAERQFEEQAQYFRQRGAVTARADYRVKTHDGVETPRQCIDDVRSAVRWLRERASALGVDPRKVAAAGGSGSAHLVASAASAQETADAMLVYHPDIDDLDPATFRAMTAAEHARRLPRTIVFIGTRDPMIDLTREWTGRLRAHGAPLTLSVGDGGLHGYYKFSPWLERTTLEADRFLVAAGLLDEGPRVQPPSLAQPVGYGKRTEQNVARWMERHRLRSAPPEPEHFYHSYGDRRLRIVFHYPDGWSRADRRPAILFLSGGAHSPRDRDGKPYPLAAERASRNMPVVNDGPGRSFDVEAAYFAKRGMVAGRVEYRQRKQDGVLPDESTRDAALAMRWVRRNAGKLGVDPDRLVGAGGSGGAHLVASVAAMPNLHGVEGAVPDALILHFPLLDWLEGGSMTDRFLDALDGNRELALRLSPARHWRRDMPPTLLFIGEREPTFEVNRAFAEKWRAAGARLELFVGQDAPHGFSTASPWVEKATARSDEFLRSLGYLDGASAVPLPSRSRDRNQ